MLFRRFMNFVRLSLYLGKLFTVFKNKHGFERRLSICVTKRVTNNSEKYISMLDNECHMRTCNRNYFSILYEESGKFLPM